MVEFIINGKIFKNVNIKIRCSKIPFWFHHMTKRLQPLSLLPTTFPSFGSEIYVMWTRINGLRRNVIYSLYFGLIISRMYYRWKQIFRTLPDDLCFFWLPLFPVFDLLSPPLENLIRESFSETSWKLSDRSIWILGYCSTYQRKRNR